MRWGCLAALVLAACQTAQPTPDASAALEAKAPVEARVEPPVEAEVPAAVDARVDVERRWYPEASCEGTEEQREACQAKGRFCELSPLPERSPCAGKGTRCLEQDLSPFPARPPCACTCDDVYRQRAEELDPTPPCFETTNLSTGERVTLCPEPELPR